MLWVLIGGIFFGATHDFGALFASLRNKGQSIGEIIETSIGKRAKRLFLTFAYLTLILVVAAFASIVANTFKATYTADGAVDVAASSANASTAMISILFIVVAIAFGFFVYRRKCTYRNRYCNRCCCYYCLYGNWSELASALLKW